MGARRLAGVLGQSTLGDTPGETPPEVPVADPRPPPKEDPAPIVYSPLVSSSTELRERQLRWFKERERRRSRSEEPARPVDP